MYKRQLPKGVRLRPVPDKGIALAKVSEGFVPRLYNDGSRFCSIGYGLSLIHI